VKDRKNRNRINEIQQIKSHTPLIQKIQSTRFVVTMFICITATIFLPLHLITGDQWAVAIGIAGGIFGISKSIDGWRGNSYI
jgi:hypothetical protein